MKYAEMQAAIAAQPAPPAPPPRMPQLKELATGRGTLFKSTASIVRKGAEYVGSFTTPDGRAWFIEATLADHTDQHGVVRNHFALRVFEAAGCESVREMVRGAQITGDRSAIPQQVLELTEPLPFDDPLPENL